MGFRQYMTTERSGVLDSGSEEMKLDKGKAN